MALILASVGGGLVAGTLLKPVGSTSPDVDLGNDADTGASAVGGSHVATAAAPPAGAVEGHTSGPGATATGRAAGKRDSTAPKVEGREYVNVGRQIIIPVVDAGETRALMLFDLAIDVPSGLTDKVYSAEPRLRDAFLRVLFELSHTGAFSGAYTDERVVAELRGRLRDAARGLLGPEVADVLILDIMRQEM